MYGVYYTQHYHKSYTTVVILFTIYISIGFVLITNVDVMKLYWELEFINLMCS